MKMRRLIYGAVAVLLVSGGWLLGSQQTTDAQLLSSGERWTLQSAGPNGLLVFMYNSNTGVVYQVLWGDDCRDGYSDLRACFVPVQYIESGN